MRLLSIPAILLGIAIAILFFKVYGLMTRPAVPLPVAAIVSQFAPDVEIGERVSDASRTVRSMTYVAHLGFVGTPSVHGQNTPTGRTVNVAQVRLLLDEHTRSQIKPDPAKARVDAVELVTGDASVTDDIATTIMTAIRRVPIEGCLQSPDAGRLRQVHVWTTPNERGGVAMINDFFVGAPPAGHAPYMTNVIAFAGKFDGGRTLRGNYTSESCAKISQTPPVSAAELALAAAASDSLTQAVADSLGPSGGFIASQQGGSQMLNACNDHVDAAGWQSVGSLIIETELPSDFTAGAQSAQSASWRGSAGSLRASTHRGAAHAGWWSNSITSECDVFISGAPAHVDLVSTTYSRSVYATIQVRDAPAIELEGQSNSDAGQAQLLHSIRTARISAAWGRQ